MSEFDDILPDGSEVHNLGDGEPHDVMTCLSCLVNNLTMNASVFDMLANLLVIISVYKLEKRELPNYVIESIESVSKFIAAESPEQDSVMPVNPLVRAAYNKILYLISN